MSEAIGSIQPNDGKQSVNSQVNGITHAKKDSTLSKRAITRLVLTEMCELRDAGVLLDDAAKRFGVCRSTFTDRCRRYGIRGWGRSKLAQRISRCEVEKLRDEGLSKTEAARQLGMSRNYFGRFARNLGVDDNWPGSKKVNQRRGAYIITPAEIERMITLRDARLSLQEAANELGIQKGTLKDRCCRHGIRGWRPIVADKRRAVSKLALARIVLKKLKQLSPQERDKYKTMRSGKPRPSVVEAFAQIARDRKAQKCAHFPRSRRESAFG